MIEQIVEDIMHQAYKDIIEDISQALTSIIQATMLKAEYTQKALVVALSQVKRLRSADKTEKKSDLSYAKNATSKVFQDVTARPSDLKEDFVQITGDVSVPKRVASYNSSEKSNAEKALKDQAIKSGKRVTKIKPSCDRKQDPSLEFVGKLSNLENSLKHQTSISDEIRHEDTLLPITNEQLNFEDDIPLPNIQEINTLDLKQDFAEISGDLPLPVFNEEEQKILARSIPRRRATVPGSIRHKMEAEGAVPRRRRKGRKLDTGDHIWSCSHCTFKVKKKLLLKLHIKRNHINNEVFYCNEFECKYSTTTKENLKIHKFGSHSNSEDLVCKECDKRFTQKGAVQMHMRNIHLKIKEYSCSDCDYETAFKKNLGIHAKRRHGEIDKMRPSEVWKYMVEDKENEKATCSICSKIFECKNSSKSNCINSLKNHLRSKHKITVKSTKMFGRIVHWKQRDVVEKFEKSFET